jgi:O-methyltransferase
LAFRPTSSAIWRKSIRGNIQRWRAAAKKHRECRWRRCKSAPSKARSCKLHSIGAKLLACDVSEEWTTKARDYWRQAQVDDVIELVLAPATQTLDARIAAGEGGQYDFGFIDADKTGYDSYYERGLQLLRKGGAMLFDNMLWSGRVADAADTTPDTSALRALAHNAKADAGVHAAMTNIGDGVLICVKK